MSARSNGGKPGIARPDHPIPDERLLGRPLVMMLDVDGTLAPIAPHPSLATVPAETRRAVAALAARDSVRIALVSGRAAHDARRMVAVANVWTIGNHGAEVITPAGDVIVDPEVARYGPSIAQAAATLKPLLKPLHNVVLENKSWTLSVHYRMADEHVLPRLRAAVEGVTGALGLRLTTGKMIFEIRPPVRVDKGTAVYRLARELGALGEDAALVFVGDDETDEDAFRVLRARVPKAVTVRVGGAGEPRATAAEYAVASPDDVRALLVRLAELEARRGE